MTAVRAAVSVVDYGSARSIDDLLDRRRRVVVFHPAERRHAVSRRGVEGWAGRLAAKQAVARLLDLDENDDGVLADIEIVVRPARPCTDPALCAIGHPVAVALTGTSAAAAGREVVSVSISHAGGIAVGAALAAPRAR